MQKNLIILAIVIFAALAVPRFSAKAASSGDLVKGTPSAVYYVTADNRRFAFPNESTYFTWYKDFSKVKTISDTEIASLPLAGLVTVRPGTAPVRIQSDTKMYAVARGGRLCELASDSIAAMIYGNDWKSKVMVVPDAFYVSYKQGSTVTEAGQYWWREEMDGAPTIESNIHYIANDPSSVLKSFTVIPKTTAKKTINLAVGLWDPYESGNASTPKKETVEQMIFTGDKSVHGYFSEMSGGSVTMANAGVFGWYKADKPAEHYWADPDPTDADGDGYVHGHNEKWAETIKKMDKELDFSAFDTNHDGALSPDELGVLIVIPADGPFGTNRVVYAQEHPTLQSMTVDGVTIGMIAEWYTGNPPNFGAPAHELSHLFFDTADMYLDGKYRAASLSLMDGSYCNCDLDPWHRLFGGKNWLNILLPNGSGYYELSPVDASYSVMKIPRPGSEEFLLVEYRQHNAYNDTGRPGLLVWDILDPAMDGDWGRNKIHLLRANGGEPVNDSLASYHGTSQFPVSTGILKWFDDSSSGISIDEIGESLATIKFKLTLPQ